MDLTEQQPLELRRSTHGGYLFVDQKIGGEGYSKIILHNVEAGDVDEELLQEMVDRYNEHTLLKRTLQQYHMAIENTKPENLEKLKKEFEGVDDPMAYEMNVASLRIDLKRMERKVAALIVTLG